MKPRIIPVGRQWMCGIAFKRPPQSELSPPEVRWVLGIDSYVAGTPKDAYGGWREGSVAPLQFPFKPLAAGG